MTRRFGDTNNYNYYNNNLRCINAFNEICDDSCSYLNKNSSSAPYQKVNSMANGGNNFSSADTYSSSSGSGKTPATGWTESLTSSSAFPTNVSLHYSTAPPQPVLLLLNRNQKANGSSNLKEQQQQQQQATRNNTATTDATKK
ncbi:hypothetical protein HK100_006563, partial [Physocladia obscura]